MKPLYRTSARAALWGRPGFIRDCMGRDNAPEVHRRYPDIVITPGDFRLIRKQTVERVTEGLRYCPTARIWTDDPTVPRWDEEVPTETPGIVGQPPAAQPPTAPAMHEEHRRTDSNGTVTWNIDLDNAPLDRLGSVEALLAHYKVDTRLWRVKTFIINGWEMGAKDPEGNLIKQALGQIKAVLVENRAVKTALDEIALLRAEATLAFPIPPSIYRTSVLDPDYCLELSLPDAHFGKLAWGEETGWGDYDLGIAANRYRTAIAAIMSRTSHYNFAKILFVLGNDLFNADNKQNLTTRGTPQDTDTRYQKSFLVVRRLVTEAILTLRERCPVDVVMVSGNHDQLATWHLGDSLGCLFERDPEVQVNNAPALRKYGRWGTTQILWTHGDKESWKSLPLLMARERPGDWAQARYHEVHTGHRHDTWCREEMGVRVRRLPSLTGTDAYHSEHGFVGNIASAEGYCFHRTEGLVDVPVYNVPE